MTLVVEIYARRLTDLATSLKTNDLLLSTTIRDTFIQIKHKVYSIQRSKAQQMIYRRKMVIELNSK